MQMHAKFIKEQEGKFFGELQWENKAKELKRSIIPFICKWVMLELLIIKRYDKDCKVNFISLEKWSFYRDSKISRIFIREQIFPSFYTLLYLYHLWGKRKKQN